MFPERSSTWAAAARIFQRPSIATGRTDRAALNYFRVEQLTDALASLRMAEVCRICLWGRSARGIGIA
jgi:hypothetical protein